MKITNVGIYPVKSKESKVKAMCQVTIDEEFVIKGIKLIKGEKGLFVAFPNVKKADGEYDDICFPITAETREYFQDCIIQEAKKYNFKTKKTSKKQDDDELPF